MSNIKILSWNIWGGQHYPEIIKTLREADADIIGLQEVIEDLDGTKNTAKMIAEELGYDYAYAPTGESETAQLYSLLEPKTVHMGNAVLSKSKIKETKIHQLSEERKRIAVEAVIPAGSSVLHVFSTHLVHTHQQPLELQNLQARNLLALVPRENAIVMGDFNALPESDCVKIMNAGMKKIDDGMSPTWSVYPEGCPVCNPQSIDIRLDYIFTTPDMKTKSFTVHDSKGSDHLPISAVLEL